MRNTLGLFTITQIEPTYLLLYLSYVGTLENDGVFLGIPNEEGIPGDT